MADSDSNSSLEDLIETEDFRVCLYGCSFFLWRRNVGGGRTVTCH